jgi:uncharacterized C2H2 Zn-finger protein
MEKTFALSSAIPDLMSNGKVAIYKTFDVRVSYLVIIDGDFEWASRAKQEVFRCPRCKSFIFPDEKTRIKDGIKYHKDCKPQRKEKTVAEEVRPSAEADISESVSPV